MTFSTAALAHAPTTQIAAHTGGRVPLTFVRAGERAPQPARRLGRLVDPRKSVSIAFPGSQPPSEISAYPEVSRSRKPPRKPITRWMLRGANVRDAVQGRYTPCGHTTTPSSRNAADRYQDRCGVYPFALVPLEEHEAALQTKYRCSICIRLHDVLIHPGPDMFPWYPYRMLRQFQASTDSPVVISGGLRDGTVRRAAKATPVSPKLVHLKKPGETVSDQIVQVPSGVSGSPSSRQAVSVHGPFLLHTFAPIAGKVEIYSGSAGTGRRIYDVTADAPLGDVPMRARARKSLADRFDCVDTGSRSTPSVALDVASVSNLQDASRSALSILSYTTPGATTGLSVVGGRSESNVHLRPLASYLDSLRETARAATIRQSSANGTGSDVRQVKQRRQSSRQDGFSTASRSVEPQTTLNRYVRFHHCRWNGADQCLRFVHAQADGISGPYDGATRDPASRRTLRPGSAHTTWMKNRKETYGYESYLARDAQHYSSNDLDSQCSVNM